MKDSGRPTRGNKSTLLLIYEQTSLTRKHAQLNTAIVVTASMYIVCG